MKALGLIELLGYVPAVVALDTALKTAEVSFQQISKIDKGIVSLTVTGDVSAVQAAMDAAGRDCTGSICRGIGRINC